MDVVFVDEVEVARGAVGELEGVDVVVLDDLCVVGCGGFVFVGEDVVEEFSPLVVGEVEVVEVRELHSEVGEESVFVFDVGGVFVAVADELVYERYFEFFFGLVLFGASVG